MNPIVSWHLTCALSLLLASSLAGCGADAPDPIVAGDPWLNSREATDVEVEPVPSSTYYPVPAGRLLEAEQILAHTAISQISPSEAEYFAGHPVEMPDVTRPFLIRGLYRSERSFFVRIVGDALWVGSHDDPADRAPLQRQPLVLIMEEVPERVYVTTGR